MIKKILCFGLALIACFTITLIGYAEDYEYDGEGFVYDGAKIIGSYDETLLSERLGSISDTYGTQILIITVKTSGGRDIDRLVEDIYDKNGFGYGSEQDGILLLVSMNPREYRILSNGPAASVLTSGVIDEISSDIVVDLAADNYVDAFNKFANCCEYYLEGNVNGFPFEWQQSLVIALVIGAIVGVIVALCLKAQLISVRKQNLAHEYVREGSMEITLARDFFLYRTLSKTERPKSNSTGSSGGGSRNIGGGSF